MLAVPAKKIHIYPSTIHACTTGLSKDSRLTVFNVVNRLRILNRLLSVNNNDYVTYNITQ